MSQNLVLRDYRVCWRFNIGIDNSSMGSDKKLQQDSKYRFLSYYMPKWSALMKMIMSKKLSVEQIKKIPELRKITLGQDLNVERLIILISKKDMSLSKKLLEAAPLFDASPKDLKLYILSVFNIEPLELEQYLTSN